MTRAIPLGFAALLCVTAAPALAQKGKETPPPAGNFQPANSYSVNANSTPNVDLNLCNNPVTIEAHGDDDTDVDFTITDPRGNQVYQDLDLDDDPIATLSPNFVNGQCQLYHMALRNLGNVYNQVQVSVRSGSTGTTAPSVATIGWSPTATIGWTSRSVTHARASWQTAMVTPMSIMSCMIATTALSAPILRRMIISTSRSTPAPIMANATRIG